MNVKSISLDLWSAEEIALLRIGGNTNFKNFLKRFDLHDEPYKKYMRTQAVQYYRIMVRIH